MELITETEYCKLEISFPIRNVQKPYLKNLYQHILKVYKVYFTVNQIRPLCITVKQSRLFLISVEWATY